MPNDEGLSTTWSHLLEKARAQAEYALQGPLHEIVDDLLPEPDMAMAPGDLGSAAETMARIAVALGPARLDSVSSLNEAFEKVVGLLTKQSDEPRVVPVAFLLEYDNTLRCCGRPPRGASPEADWLGVLTVNSRRLDEELKRIVAFLAIARRQVELLPRIVGGTIPPSFEAARTFQFNVDGFIRYLAAAIANNATAEDIEPAWTDFLTAFPRLLGSEVLTWAGLLAAARAVFIRFHGAEIGTVAQRLHERVTQLP